MGEVKPVETDEIIIAKSKILEVPRTKFVPLEGKEGVKIRSLTPSELGEIYLKQAGGMIPKAGESIPLDKAMSLSYEMLRRAIVEPVLTLEEIQQLRLDYLPKLLEEVIAISGLARPSPEGKEVPLPT